MNRSPCPSCHDCDFPRGVCERLANRGRRFFLMGMLAVPLARKIERVAEKLIVPALGEPRIVITGQFGQEVWTWSGKVERAGWHPLDAQFAVAT